MNMIDYLTWRGDLSFETAAFNDVDNLLCSYLYIFEIFLVNSPLLSVISPASFK